MALCRKDDIDAIAAAASPVRIHRLVSKQDTANPSEGVSIFASFKSDPKSGHPERFLESRSDLEQVVTSFGAFCELLTLRLEAVEDAVAGDSPGEPSRPSRNQSDAGQVASASERVLREWMAVCRRTDKDVMLAADAPLRAHGSTTKQDTGNPAEGVSIFSTFIGQPERDHPERFQESQTDFGQVLSSFGAFCESMTLRLEADEAANTLGPTSRPSRYLKRVGSADGRARIQRIRTRRCSSCDGREGRWFDSKHPATDGRWSLSLPDIAL